MEEHFDRIHKEFLEVYDFIIGHNAALKEVGVEVPEDARKTLQLENIKTVVVTHVFQVVVQAREDPDKRLIKAAKAARTLPKGTTERIDALITLTLMFSEILSALVVSVITKMTEIANKVNAPEEKMKELADTLERAEKSYTRIEALVKIVPRREVARGVGLKILLVFDYIMDLLDKRDVEMKMAAVKI